jgi:DnaJ-class molecular chaperone
MKDVGVHTDNRVQCPKCGGAGDLNAGRIMSPWSKVSCDLCRGTGKVSQKAADSYSPPYPGKDLEL